MDYCLPCFGRSRSSDNEREPLIPKHGPPNSQQQTNGSSSSVAERPLLDKIVDALAALNAGKLPTQEQFTRLFQQLLKSELLKDNAGKVVSGNGPMSKQGRKVIGDVRVLIYTLLQFGMEKNVDDKFQELYFQISRIESSPVDVEVNVEINKPAAYKAGQTAFEKTKEGVKDIAEEAPTKDQLQFDAATLVYSLRTLLETCISSPTFRLVLVDMVSIARDVVAHAAIDVQHAADQVHHVAEEVEEKARDGNDVIAQEDGGKLTINTSVEEMRVKGKEAAQTIAEGVRDVRAEWKGVGKEVTDQTKEKILERIQQTISRIQKDEASRSAMRSILILARKYADRLAAVSETATAALVDVAKETRDALTEEPATTKYPPHRYDAPHERKPLIDVTSDAILREVKVVLERLGQGHSLNGLLSALGRVVRDINEVPTIVSDEINKTIDEKVEEAAHKERSPTPRLDPQSSRPNADNKTKEPGIDAEDPFSLQGSTHNPLAVYFSQFGQYLDKALDEPGWVMSGDGAKTLESLFDDGIILFNAVGESVVDIGDQIISEDAPDKGPAHTTLKGSSDEDIRRQFRIDLKSLVGEVGAYVAAVENDKTTMRLVRVLELLGDDLSVLFFQGSKQGPRSLSRSVAGIRGWTDWIGWLVPRLLRMLPSNAIPIPSIEVKSGPLEVALYALFVQGLSRGSGVGVGEPVKTSLIPDEVVFKEWTEVKIDMVDYDADPLHQSSSAPSSSVHPGVQTTSRIRMHMDGVRAKIEGISYYFKYGAGILGYEDQGLLSIDVGMSSVHDGLGADIELELESESVVYEEPALQIPEIIVEGEVDDAENIDVQRAVASPGSPIGQGRILTAQKAVWKANPLFKVVDVQVAMRGLHFSIDQSRHWILNKLLLQPLAGSVVARVAKQAMEEKLRSGLEVVARGLGIIVQDAKRLGEIRRAERRRRRAATKKSYSVAWLDEDEENESLGDFLPDWYRAFLQNAPALVGYDVSGQEPPAEEIDDNELEGYGIETTTGLQASMKGVVYTSKTKTTVTNGATDDQPHEQPPMVYRKSTGSMERVDFMSDEEYNTPLEEFDETVVAVGGGPQLFPSKVGPYGATSDGDEGHQGLLKSMSNGVEQAVEGATSNAKQGAEVVDRIEHRWGERREAEQKTKRTWRSEAFDF